MHGGSKVGVAGGKWHLCGQCALLAVGEAVLLALKQRGLLLRRVHHQCSGSPLVAAVCILRVHQMVQQLHKICQMLVQQIQGSKECAAGDKKQ